MPWVRAVPRKFCHFKIIAVLLALSLATALFPYDAARADDPVAWEDGSVAAVGVGGSVPDATPALSVHDANGESARALSLSNLPAKYSSADNGNVSPVKDQGSLGTCWSFAAAAAMESSLLASNQATQADLSERHLAYFTYHGADDPLGNIPKDVTQAASASFNSLFAESSDPYLASGGNASMLVNTLSSWKGAVNESVAPYEALLSAFQSVHDSAGVEAFLVETALDTSKAYGLNSAYLEGAYQISMQDRDDVKQAIMEYGAASVQVQSDFRYFNSDNNAFYCYYDTDADHEVVLVGWNDDYGIENFGVDWIEETRPSQNGAWLCKNSWGSSWGDGGYYWLSYEDVCLNKETAKATVFSMETESRFDNIYQYDGTAGACYNYVKSGGSIANVFEAKANPSGTESIEAVSFRLEDVNVDYSVQVYVGVEDQSDPTSGQAMFGQQVVGKTNYAGYYTVQLPDPVVVGEGTAYSVVVTLSHEDGSRVGYCVDTTYGAGDRYEQFAHYYNDVLPGQSFELDSADGHWFDLSSDQANGNDGDEPACSARLKAFTNNSEEEAPGLVGRLSGKTSDATAAAISAEAFPNGSDWVVLARDDDFADAMSATGLAGALGAPIVLTNRSDLSAAARDEIVRLGATKAYVIGGRGAMPGNFTDELSSLGVMQVERVYGSDSWDTSVECARKIAEHGGNANGDAIVAMSGNFQDALSISSFAYKYSVPIYLQTPDRQLTGEALVGIQALTGSVYVAGGNGAVPLSSVEGLLGSDRTVVRLSGNTGYDTSNQIATYMVGKGLLSPSVVCVASGAQVAKGTDALAGAALAGINGGVMLLVSANQAMEKENYTVLAGEDSKGVQAFLAANASSISEVYVLGGRYVMPEAFVARLNSVLIG